MPFGFSPTQLLLVLAIVLLVFGAKRLPEIARNLGSSTREFRDAVNSSEVEGGSDVAGNRSARTALAGGDSPSPAEKTSEDEAANEATAGGDSPPQAADDLTASSNSENVHRA